MQEEVERPLECRKLDAERRIRRNLGLVHSTYLAVGPLAPQLNRLAGRSRSFQLRTRGVNDSALGRGRWVCLEHTRTPLKLLRFRGRRRQPTLMVSGKLGTLFE